MKKHGRKKEIDQQIDENLKRVFEEAAKEPLPDRFSDLIEQLRQKEQGGVDGK